MISCVREYDICRIYANSFLDKILEKQAFGAPLDLAEIRQLSLLSDMIDKLQKNQIAIEKLGEPPTVTNVLQVSSAQDVAELRRLARGESDESTSDETASAGSELPTV